MFYALVSAALAVEVLDQDPPGAFERVKLDVGGFVQPRFNYVQADEDAGTLGERGLAVRRVRSELKGEMSAPAMGIGGDPLALRWALSVEMMTSAKLQDAYVELDLAKPLQIRVGQMKTPASRTYVVSDRAVLFPDRPDEIELFPDRDIGVSVLGALGERHLEYQVGAFNGEGTNIAHNENQRFLSTWRLVASPFGSPGTKTELMGYKEDATFSVGYEGFLNFTGLPGEQRADFAHGAEVFGHYKHLTAQGELHWAQSDFEDKGVVDYTVLGGYAQAALFVPAPWVQDHVALVGRVEQVDPFRPELGEQALEGPTDERQAHRNLVGGVGLYAGEPWFKNVQQVRVVVAYTHKQELDGLAWHNDEVTVGAHVNF